MKRINIFRAGKHTASCGFEANFSEDNLSSAVSAYNPKLHEAPIVIGHPKSNNPAFGWIKSLSFDDGNIFAEPHQLNADFQEMVESKAFKKVSASWYLPDHPSNPTPGTLHLRHVGFLGAQPPAIKGLSAIEFEEADDQIVEFEEEIDQTVTIGAIQKLFNSFRKSLVGDIKKPARP